MRNKETEADYRYFPDANLMPIIIDDEWIEEIKKNRPVEINDKVVEYSEAGISEKEIDVYKRQGKYLGIEMNLKYRQMLNQK